MNGKAIRCIFLGYPSRSKGYRCYNPILVRLIIPWMSPFLKILPISVLTRADTCPQTGSLPIPVFDFSVKESLVLPYFFDQFYTRCPRAQELQPTMPESSSGTSNPPLVISNNTRRYPTRERNHLLDIVFLLVLTILSRNVYLIRTFQTNIRLS